MGRAETPSQCGAEIVTDRAEFDARAWNTGKIAGMPRTVTAVFSAALRNLSARRHVVLISTSEI
jgi:hypothetical protein